MDPSGFSCWPKSCLRCQVRLSRKACSISIAVHVRLFQLYWQRRGVISLEDLPVTESAFGQQAVILMPQALQITAETAKAALADHLSAASLHALQVIQ